MKNFNYTIQIPEPCHEDWNNMQPDAQGKFCGSCQKSVIDFSNKSDTEIKNILLEQKGKKICGHFKKTQIDRPLNFRVDLNQLPKNVSSTKAFAIAVFLVFGTFLFSCTDLSGQSIGKIEVVPSESTHYTKGKIKMPNVVNREDTLPNKDTTKLIIMEEPMISGGIRFSEIPATEDSLVKVCPPAVTNDSAFIEPVIMGDMIIESIEESIDEPEAATPKGNGQHARYTPLVTLPDLKIYPNPSAGDFIVSYTVVTRTNVELNIVDIKGLLVKQVINQQMQHAGQYRIPVSLKDLPDTIYFVQLLIGDKKLTEKVILKK